MTLYCHYSLGSVCPRMTYMKNNSAIYGLFHLACLLTLVGCTADKLQARLEADPQCKSIINPKTGTLMPCPGSDKEFYKSIPALNTKTLTPSQELAVQPSISPQDRPVKPAAAPVECKPSLHQKSGVLMPCPAP